MATKAAYYEGLQYASKDVKNVDFGGLALGIAQAEKEKIEKQEREKKERDQFQMNIYDKYGEVIYPTFDKTGLEQADIYQTGLAQMISARSQDLNERFNSNEINQVEYTREMSKLKGQAQQFRSNFDSIGKFVEDYREMGEDVDPSTQDSMDFLNNLFSDAKPYLNEDNLIGNFSVVKDKDGKPRIESFLWDKVSSRLQVNKKYDQFEIPKQILGVQGELSKFVADDAVLKTHLTEGGQLKPSTLNLIKEQISTLSDNQLMSYARQMGLSEKDGASWNPDDITSLSDRGALEAKITQDQQEKTLALLQQKDALDEVSKRELDIKAQKPYSSAQRVKGDTMRAAYEIALKIGEGGDKANDLIDQVVSNNDSIENILYNKEKDSWVIEKIDSKGIRSDSSIKVPRNEDGSVDNRNLGVSLMSAISPGYNVEQAELAARDFQKKNPNYSFTNNIDEFDRGYIPFSPLSSIQIGETNKGPLYADSLISSSNAEDLQRDIPKALKSLGIDKGYRLSIEKRLIRPTSRWARDYQQLVLKIDIPGGQTVYIEPTKSVDEVIDMIPGIANDIKKTGALISSPGSTSNSGKKQLPGK